MTVIVILLLDLILGIKGSITQIETCYILFLVIPIASFSCLSRPVENSFMKRHVLSPKYLDHLTMRSLDYAIYLLRQSAIKVIMAGILFYLVRIYYLYAMI